MSGRVVFVNVDEASSVNHTISRVVLTSSLLSFIRVTALSLKLIGLKICEAASHTSTATTTVSVGT